MAVPAVWSSHLASIAITSTSGWQVIYTVPHGFVLILKQLSSYNASGGASSIIIGDGTGPVVHQVGPLDYQELDEWYPWLVFDEDATVACIVDHEPWSVYASGQLLTKP